MKKEFLISRAKYLFATGVLMAFNAVNVFAQGVGQQKDLGTALSDATGKVSQIFDVVANLCLVAAALVGLVGGISVYSKFSSGDPDGGKRIGKWVGGAIFIGLVPTILKALFISQ